MKIKYYLSLFREASKLDIFDLAYEFSSESLNTLSSGYWMKVNGLPRKGATVRIGIYFRHFYKSLIEYWHRRRTTMLPGGFVFFALSKNEIDSLKPVSARMPTAYLTGSNEAPFPFPFVWAYTLSCAYLPLVVNHFLKAKGYKKKSFGYIFDHYWLSYGLYITARMWFQRQRPRAVVLANHLYTYHRVLYKAARDEHIPAFYLQHASIPAIISPLQSDYALLEGRVALSRLAHAGMTPVRIFLIGMPKFDAYLRHINVQARVHSIGVCTNDLGPLLRTEQLLAQIRQEFTILPLILRPHNADLRVSEWQDLAGKYGVEFSDSRLELSFDFLRRVDSVIAGDSGILLEAALMDVLPLYYDFTERKLDWYGFQHYGLVEYFSEPQQVCRCIEELSRNKPSVRAKAKLYCATVGTRHDGHSGELAATLIQSLVSGAPVDRSIWKRIPDIGLEAYELV
ncbi:MAG: hypothetical protein KKC28_15090 [Verrucomicrobia bacterium]|nr:hypothetical protein [Verrucomicrobiota bacterium]